MDERQAAILKRKREEDSELSDSSMVEPEKPKTDQILQNPKAKKRKLADPEPESSKTAKAEPNAQETEEERIQRRKEQKAAKKERKKEKKVKQKEKSERQKARKKEAKQQQQKQEKPTEQSVKHMKRPADSTANDKQSESSDDESDEDDIAEAISINRGTAFSAGAPIEDDDMSMDASDQEPEEVFSPLHDSGISSSSSVQPAASENQSRPQDQAPSSGSRPTVDKKAKTTLQHAPQPADSDRDPKQRLQAAISAFRAERKADSGPKSRSELLEQRRRQEERRRAEKKEQKRREKEEAARKQEEEIAKRFSPGGSGSLLGSPRSPITDADTNNFSFGRVAFSDGSAFDPTSSSTTETHRKKGPSDPVTALKAAQSKQQRVSGYDADKRATIQEKDMWMNARKRAAGEKVKDDTSLLKKALKRHEGQKKKSEQEWNERKEGVRKSIDMKQKKRTENLTKRKDEKGQKGKKGKLKRPGFEGSFRGRTGGGKKNA